MSSITITVAHLAPVTVDAAEAPALLARTLVEDAQYYGAWHFTMAKAEAEAADILAGMLPGETMRAGSEYEIRVLAA